MSALLLAGLLLASGSALATQAEHVHASHAWIRLLPAGLPAGGYVTLRNDSAQAAQLSQASSPDYANVMLHRSRMVDGMSTMTRVEHIDIPAHGQATLAPGGYHLMLMKAIRPPKAGDKLKVILRFADGSSLPVDFLARPANAVGPG
ncbi:copper chaperone PCu(A)C [Dyella sp. A6]|uniref:copper chaperone PCu(A)C n=1 Tax=Dyella aluminiiresistens TaxID=3069105 RepID=UPI002E780D04|nr:copper chaperone PCu(A)C [Dyella sp. A6]